MCNWIHKINMRSDDFRTVVRTFIEVFGDHAQLWDLGHDALLIGSKAPVRFDAKRFAGLLESPEIARDLSGLGITSPETFLRHFELDAAALRAYAGASGALNTDSFPVLEFSCPYGLYGHERDAFESLTLARHAEIDASWLIGMDGSLERARKAADAFRRKLRVEALWARNFALGSKALTLERPDASITEVFSRRAGEIIAGLKAIEEQTRGGLDPWVRERANGLAATALGTAQRASLEETLVAGLLQAAAAHLSLRQHEQGAVAVKAALAIAPQDPRVLQTQGVFEATAGRFDSALASLAEALVHAKDGALRSEIHRNTGATLEAASRPQEAVGEYEKALAEDPANEPAKARLVQLRKQLGQPPGQ